MSDRKLSVEVLYDDNGALREVKKLDTALEGVGTTTAKTGGIAGGVFKGALAAGVFMEIARSVGGLTIEMIGMGDQIVKIADRTGLTTKAVQELGYIAGQSGNTIDQITAALGQMQNRLAEGDKSAVSALRQLGLRFEDLRDLNPDEQFYAIASAIATVESPMERTRLAMDLFGRAGSQILPTLLSDFQNLRDEAPKMSDATVRALDTAGDRMDWLTLRAKVLAAEGFNALWNTASLAMGSGWIDLFGKAEPPVLRVSAAMERARASMQDVSDRGAKPLSGDLGLLTRTLDFETRPAVTKTTEALIEYLTPAEKALLTLPTLAAPKLTVVNGLLVGQGQAVTDLTPKFLGWAAAVEPITAKQLPIMYATLPGVTKGMTAFGAEAAKTGATIKDKLLSVLTNLPSAITAMVTGGISGFATGATSIIGTLVGGPWGAAIGAAGGALSALLGKVFKSEGKKVNDLRDEFIAAAGGIGQLAQKALEAGTNVDALLKASTVKDYEAAVQSLTSAFDAQNEKLAEQARLKDEIADVTSQIADLENQLVPSWEQINAVVERYGLNLDALGPKVNQLRINDEAKQIIEDFGLMERAGAELGVVLEGMAPKINAMVQESAALGVALPENMRPILQRMVDLGLLLDADGRKLTDLGGIQFGEAVKTEADKIAEAIKGLNDQLSALVKALEALVNPSKTAAEQVQEHWRRAPWQDWPSPEWPEGGEESPVPARNASGAIGSGMFAPVAGRASSGVVARTAGASMRGVEAKLDQVIAGLERIPAGMRDAVLVRG